MKKKPLMITGAVVLVSSALALLKVKKSKNTIKEEAPETAVKEQTATQKS